MVRNIREAFGNPARIAALIACAALVNQYALAGVGKMNVRYLGGSWTDVRPGQEGKFHYTDKGIVFQWKGTAPHLLRYDSITSIEYGQKVGRRIGATIALGVTTLGLMALPLLLSKKRKHFATIGFRDEDGERQALVLEFGKRATKAALNTMALRSGIEIEFESEEARKHFRH